MVSQLNLYSKLTFNSMLIPFSLFSGTNNMRICEPIKLSDGTAKNQSGPVVRPQRMGHNQGTIN